MKPFVLRFIFKQQKLITFSIDLVLILSFLSYFLFFNQVQAVWLGMSRENRIDNLSNTSSDSKVPQIQLDNQGNSYIVWSDDSAGNGDIFFKKWTVGAGPGICGTGIDDCWTKMDGTLGHDNLSANSGVSNAPQIMLDSANKPYVVWSDNTEGYYEIYFSKWTPGAGAGVCGGPTDCWTNMAGTVLGSDNLSNNAGDSIYQKIQLNSSSNPYVVWQDNTTGNDEIYFTKWTPGAGAGVCGGPTDCWTKMAGTVSGYDNLSNNAGNSKYSEIQLDSNNNPYVVWEDATTGLDDIYFSKWTPGAGPGVCGGIINDCWTNMAGTTPGYDNLSNSSQHSEIFRNNTTFVLDRNNIPYVVWGDGTTGFGDIYFTKWTSSVGWTQMDGATLGYDNLSNNAGVSGAVQIQLDRANNPYVVWHDDTTGNFEIYLSKWMPAANAWTQMDGVTPGYENISNTSGSSVSPQIQLDSAGNPYIAWLDVTLRGFFNYDLYFSKWTPGGWTQMDGTTPGHEIISNDSGSAAPVYFQIELNNVNFPYLVWQDYTPSNSEIYFTRWLLQERGQIAISASVDPSLTLSLSSTTCNLGTFDSANLKTCSYGAEVSTNGSSGYTSFIKADGNLRNATNSIANVSGGSVTAATESYGLSTTKDSQTISQINDADSDTYYTQADCTSLDNQNSMAMTASALTTSDQTFASSSGPVAADMTYLCHAVAITGTTPAGVYTQLVTITVVGNF